MSLIQPLKFRTLKTGCFKMPRLQMGVFRMGITVASGLCVSYDNLCPEAIVTLIWKMAICKRGILKHPVFNILNFRGWIKHIFDTVD